MNHLIFPNSQNSLYIGHLMIFLENPTDHNVVHLYVVHVCARFQVNMKLIPLIEISLMILYDVSTSMAFLDQFLGQCGHLNKSTLVYCQFLILIIIK